MKVDKRGCIGRALYYRLVTWSMLDAATYGLRPKMGFHWRGKHTEDSIRHVKSVEWVFLLRGKHDIIDPFMSKDFGGEEKAWNIVLDMRHIVELIENENYDEAYNWIHRYQQFFYHHALNRYHECLEGGIDIDEGISYRIETRKVEVTEELIEHNRIIREKVEDERKGQVLRPPRI